MTFPCCCENKFHIQVPEVACVQGVAAIKLNAFKSNVAHWDPSAEQCEALVWWVAALNTLSKLITLSSESIMLCLASPSMTQTALFTCWQLLSCFSALFMLKAGQFSWLTEMSPLQTKPASQCNIWRHLHSVVLKVGAQVNGGRLPLINGSGATEHVYRDISVTYRAVRQLNVVKVRVDQWCITTI